jgi:hypothetical protein
MNSPKSISSYPVEESAPEQTAEVAPLSSRQEEALRHFAKNLLTVTEDSPQEVVEILNRHFWDVV